MDEATELIDRLAKVLQINHDYIMGVNQLVEVYANELPLAFIRGISYIVELNTARLNNLEA